VRSYHTRRRLVVTGIVYFIMGFWFGGIVCFAAHALVLRTCFRSANASSSSSAFQMPAGVR
jgi:hypothetical protein